MQNGGSYSAMSISVVIPRDDDAAIAGVRYRSLVELSILHPKRRVSSKPRAIRRRSKINACSSLKCQNSR